MIKPLFHYFNNIVFGTYIFALLRFFPLFSYCCIPKIRQLFRYYRDSLFDNVNQKNSWKPNRVFLSKWAFMDLKSNIILLNYEFWKCSKSNVLMFNTRVLDFWFYGNTSRMFVHPSLWTVYKTIELT